MDLWPRNEGLERVHCQAVFVLDGRLGEVESWNWGDLSCQTQSSEWEYLYKRKRFSSFATKLLQNMFVARANQELEICEWSRREWQWYLVLCRSQFCRGDNHGMDGVPRPQSTPTYAVAKIYANSKKEHWHRTTEKRRQLLSLWGRSGTTEGRYIPIIATLTTAEPENWPSAFEKVSQNVV